LEQSARQPGDRPDEYEWRGGRKFGPVTLTSGFLSHRQDFEQLRVRAARKEIVK